MPTNKQEFSLHFDHVTNDFRIYHSRLKQAFIRDSVTKEDVKKAYLLSSLSEGSYRLLESLMVPDTVDDATYNTLIGKFETYFTPPTSYFTARHNLFMARKQANETPREWSARVSGLATKCGYGTEIKVVLRDVFVCGYEPGPVQDRMMEEDASLATVTFSDLVELAALKEATLADRQGRSTHSTSTPSTSSVKAEPPDDINYMKRRDPKNHDNRRPRSSKDHKHQGSSRKLDENAPKCLHCGRKNHSTESCLYKDATCHLCHIAGHLATICPMRDKNRTTSTRYLEEVDEEDGREEEARSESDIPSAEEDDIYLEDSFFHLSWDEWSDWSACSTSCGDGTQHRWRYCLLQAGCSGYNKQTRKCNSFPCNGVVAPLTLEDKKYFHPSQWERVRGRETAWRLKPNSYLWLPAAELPFPTNYFRNHFALLLSLKIDPKKPAGGTLFSLRSRRQEECYFAVELAGQDAIKLVHSGPNGTQSVLIPALMGDGKWHRLALGIQDDSSVRSYFDCRWVSTDILKKNSLDIPEDADLVIGYLFSGELEDMVLVGDPSGVAQQCSTNLTPSLDPLLEAARPHRKPHKLKQITTKTWAPTVPLDTNRLVSDDEDFEGSGLSSNSEGDWSDWSECNATCGPGVQSRSSICPEGPCSVKTETRPCVVAMHCKQADHRSCHCENGGVCKKHGECRCRAGWEGTDCSTPVCRPRCRNGGICSRPGVCHCSDHYTGSICQTPICDPACQNGGHCVGNNQCLCPPNTSGDHCQNYTCEEGCLNGGACVGPGLCECPHNATGDRCGTPICDPPCENGATCAPGNTCLCLPHSSGPRCHDKKCEYRPVQEPYVRGYRRLLVKKHFETKCDPRDWKNCLKNVPEYQNVYERAYRTTYKCVPEP